MLTRLLLLLLLASLVPEPALAVPSARFFKCAPPQGPPESFPYPFPAEPRQAVTVQRSYSGLSGGTAASASFPGASPSWGEATGVATSVNVGKVMNAFASPAGANIGEELGRSNEAWTVNSRFHDFGFSAFVSIICGSTPCGPQNIQGFRLQSVGGNRFLSLPRFSPNAPDAYDLSPYAAATVNVSLATTYVPGKGSISSLDETADIRIDQALIFRPWATTDLFAGRVHPTPAYATVQGIPKQHMKVLPPTARFNFSQVGAGHASQYHHFNWYQELYDYRRDSTSPADGVHMTAAELKRDRDWQDRGFGPDPALNSQFGAKVDKYLPYFDEELIAGRDSYFWSNRQHGLFFQDIPKLKKVGDQAFYRTVLLGVRPDGVCENLSKAPVANAAEFKFAWSYRQTSPPDTGTGSIVQLLENVDETIAGVGEGEVTLIATGEDAGDFEGLVDEDFDQSVALTDNCASTYNFDQLDTEADGVGDACDDCMLVANELQIDTDLDGYGNACDADLNQDGIVNFADLAILKGRFFQQDANADLTGDNLVNFADLARMKALFFQPPGPSGLHPQAP